MSKLTYKQIKALTALYEGGAFWSKHSNDKGPCFMSNEDGWGAALTCTLTFRSLLRRKLIRIGKRGMVNLTDAGRQVLSEVPNESR